MDEAKDIKMQVCRLCFKQISDNNFSQILGSLKDMLQVITTDVNLKTTYSPVMCTECSESLQSVFNFKTNYFESEEKIESKISALKDVKLDLRDLMNNSFNNRPKRKSANIKRIRLCRICLQSIKGQLFKFLSGYADICLLSVIESCLPEMDMNLTHNPVMCLTCYEALQKMYIFKLTCQENERKLESYIQIIGSNFQRKVDLHSVLQFLSKSMPNNVSQLQMEQSNNNKTINERKIEASHITEVDCLKYVMVKMEPDDEEIGTRQAKLELEDEINVSKYVSVKIEPIDEGGRIEQREFLRTKKCIDRSKLNVNQQIVEDETHELNKQRSRAIRSKCPQNKNKGEEECITYCSNCNFKTKYKYNLRRHLIVVHKQKDIEAKKKKTLYKCSQCKFATKWNIDLTRHLLSHVKPEALHCTRCPYSTNQNSQLIRHILSHINADNIDKYSFLQLSRKSN